MKYCSVLYVTIWLISSTQACTDFLITPGATKEGSSIISYAADASYLFGYLTLIPAADHPNGSMHQIYDFDSGEYLGEIPEVPHTYRVVGNMNEHQLFIGESTFDGREELWISNGIMDYGSLINVTLQRARTAREAINILTGLVKEYGYHSSGESFSIGDPEEVWYLELIGKGAKHKGAVWVALKIPNGSVSVHANFARITTFNLSDTQNVLASDDVISFAKDNGYYPKTSPDSHFSFSDAYCPVNYWHKWGMGVWQFRFSMARVWSFFNHVAKDLDLNTYIDYVEGRNFSHRLPLWVEVRTKLSVVDVMNLMRDDLQGTYFAQNKNIGANAFQTPKRFPPYSYNYNSERYVMDRTIGYQFTGYSQIGVMNKEFPYPIGGINWFGVDDATFAPYIPFFSALQQIPLGWNNDNAHIMHLNLDSTFWLNNLIANYFGYYRYIDVYPEIKLKIDYYENKFIRESYSIREKARGIYEQNPAAAVQMLSNFSVEKGNELRKGWLEYFEYLFMKYLDGNTKWINPENPYVPIVEWKGYPKEWYARIVLENGDKYRFPKTA